MRSQRVFPADDPSAWPLSFHIIRLGNRTFRYCNDRAAPVRYGWKVLTLPITLLLWGMGFSLARLTALVQHRLSS